VKALINASMNHLVTALSEKLSIDRFSFLKTSSANCKYKVICENESICIRNNLRQLWGFSSLSSG